MKRRLKKSIEYCPVCVEELIPQKKKLGCMVNWMVCPNCGFRKRPEVGQSLANALTDRIHAQNIKTASGFYQTDINN